MNFEPGIHLTIFAPLYGATSLFLSAAYGAKGTALKVVKISYNLIHHAKNSWSPLPREAHTFHSSRQQQLDKKIEASFEKFKKHLILGLALFLPGIGNIVAGVVWYAWSKSNHPVEPIPSFRRYSEADANQRIR
jgi:hypothetical protein